MMNNCAGHGTAGQFDYWGPHTVFVKVAFQEHD